VRRYGRKKHRAIPKPRSAEPDLINQSGHQVRTVLSSFLCYQFFCCSLGLILNCVFGVCFLFLPACNSIC